MSKRLIDRLKRQGVGGALSPDMDLDSEAAKKKKKKKEAPEERGGRLL